jgi:anti-sigma factor (TIGR02949 family)
MSLDLCRGVESNLQPYLDRQLTQGEVTMIETPLGECVYCRERYHFEARLRDTVKTVCCGDPVPEGLVERVRLACRGDRAT